MIRQLYSKVNSAHNVPALSYVISVDCCRKMIVRVINYGI